jgi:ATP-binding protein involved in chromosome partitioning
MDLFGSGGGQLVSDTLTRELGYDVPLMAKVPFDVRLREGGDEGKPLVLTDPDSPAATVMSDVSDRLSKRARGLAGMSLGITPASRA